MSPKEHTHFKKHLQMLSNNLCLALRCLDEAMKGPSTPERGKQVAAISNALEISNDRAMHFGLGLSFEKIEAMKRNAKDQAQNGWKPENVAAAMENLRNFGGTRL